MRWLWEWVDQATCTRPYHGLAYRDCQRNRSLSVLLPFNWLVRGCRYLMFVIRVPRGAAWERSSSYFVRGYSKGWDDCARVQGYNKGWNDCANREES